MKVMSGEYLERGKYHKYLDPNWSYYPVYVRKMLFIDSFLKVNVPYEHKILDAGCGEGVLVEKYRAEGRNIFGIDINISNEFVQQGNILDLPFPYSSFDLVLLLDVIEHLCVSEQEKAILELYNVLKKGGKAIISIPNLAHKASRHEFYKRGRFIRTANISKHPGDRPIKEYIDMILTAKFCIEERVPIKLTLPSYQDKILKLILGKNAYENYIYSDKRNPDDCFLNIFVLRK